MNKRYFTSDLHLGHKNVIPYCFRPYKNIEEMNEEIIKLINSTCSENDELWILGDVSLNKKYALALPKLVKCKLILVSGNHDATHPCNRRHQTMIKRYLDAGWAQVYLTTTLVLNNGQEVLLSHLPYGTKNSLKYDDRYLHYRPVDTKPLLCGHVHQSWVKLDNMVNVGVDAHQMRILSEYEVVELLNKTDNFIPVKLNWKQKIKKILRRFYEKTKIKDW